MSAGVIIIAYGPQELGFFQKATKISTPDAVLDTDAARMAGATFVVGTPGALANLKELLKPSVLASYMEQYGSSGLSANAVNWLASGARGASSNTLFTRLTGVSADNNKPAYPYDPADFGRCRRLLEACPELLPSLHKVRDVCPEWAAIVDHWDKLCTLMDAEAPNWRTGGGQARQTYELMKTIFKEAEETQYANQ